MEIGIIGADNIGSALAEHFSRLGHSVLIANSRGPETLSQVAGRTNATPVVISEAARGVDLLVVTIPMKSVPLLPMGLLSNLPISSPIIDTGQLLSVGDDSGESKRTSLYNQDGGRALDPHCCVDPKSPR